MNPTVLVIGATGKTGRRLIPLLLERGVTVRAASRAPSSPGVENVRFDWNDDGTFEAACKGVDAVYLVPPDPIKPGNPAEPVQLLLEAAAGAGAGRVVLLSQFGLDQAPPEDRLRRVELAVESSGMADTILRPGAFMQNFSERHWSRLEHTIREDDRFALPGGEARVSWVSTEDIAAVAAIALTEDGHAGKAYAVLGPEPITMAEVAAHISAAVGRRISHVESDRDQIRAGLVAAGASPQIADYLSEMYLVALGSGAFGALSDDVATVTDRAPIRFAEFAAGAVEAWRR